MTGLDKILMEIKKDSDGRISEVLASARAEEKRIVEEAEAEAKKQSDEIIEKAKSNAETIRERAKSSVEIKAGRLILSKKQEIINDLIIKAKEFIGEMDADTYSEFMIKAIEKYSHKEEGVVKFSDHDKTFANAKVYDVIKEKNLKVSEEIIDAKIGFILDYGDIEENCTIDAIFDGSIEVLSDKVCEIIFG